MKTNLRRRLEMAVRARDFLRAHRTELADEAMALDRIEAQVDRAQTLVAKQRAGVVATRSATVLREDLKREIRQLLQFIAAVSVVAGNEKVDLPVRFRLPPSHGTTQGFLTVARGMLEQATARRGSLITCRAATSSSPTSPAEPSHPTMA